MEVSERTADVVSISSQSGIRWQHFVAYSLDKTPPRLSFDPNVTIWDLRQTYFPAFEAAVKRAKVASIMGR